jgi:chloramphenicol 3-O-phosphotransferase
MSQIVIISGPSGAGKSSVAESLCERYDRTVHIETDAFFEAIRMGRLNPMQTGSDRQNRMVTRAVARAATAYAQDLFAVFIDGVIGPHLLPIYLEELRPAGVPVQFVLLMSPLEETMRRVHPRCIASCTGSSPRTGPSPDTPSTTPVRRRIRQPTP